MLHHLWFLYLHIPRKQRIQVLLKHDKTNEQAQIASNSPFIQEWLPNKPEYSNMQYAQVLSTLVSVICVSACQGARAGRVPAPKPRLSRLRLQKILSRDLPRIGLGDTWLTIMSYHVMPLDVHKFSPSCSLRFRSLSGFENTTDDKCFVDRVKFTRPKEWQKVRKPCPTWRAVTILYYVTVLPSMNIANPYKQWLLLPPESLLLLLRKF